MSGSLRESTDEMLTGELLTEVFWPTGDFLTILAFLPFLLFLSTEAIFSTGVAFLAEVYLLGETSLSTPRAVSPAGMRRFVVSGRGER